MNVFIWSTDKKNKEWYKLFNVSWVYCDVYKSYDREDEAIVVEFSVSNADSCIKTETFCKDKKDAESKYNELATRVRKGMDFDICCDIIREA